jgi:hypothetical protein
MCIPATHRAGIKAIMKHLLAEAADKENDAMLVDPSDDKSDKAVAGAPDAGRTDVSVGRKHERVECQGIPHSYLQQWGTSLSPSGLSKLLERFNYIHNRWCHKDCTGSFFRLVGSSHGSSCDHCKKGQSSVQKDRLPDLFQCPTAIADIFPSELMLKAAITNAAVSFATLEEFAKSENADDFASHLAIYGKVPINFCFGGVDHIFCHCTNCASPVICFAQEGHNQEQDECDDLLVCLQCKEQDKRNAR